MPAPKGNKNAVKGKAFYEALRKQLARSGGTVDKGLLKVAGVLLDAALEGEQWAVQEIANRIDGKPAQINILQGDEEHPLINRIERHIVRPADKDG